MISCDSNTYKAKSALQGMISYISAIIPIPRIINNRKAITYNRAIIAIPKTIWIAAIYILSIRPIAKAVDSGIWAEAI